MLSQQFVSMSQNGETEPSVSGGMLEPEDAPS